MLLFNATDSPSVVAMPFSLQLLGVLLLHETGRSPDENAGVQERAKHNHETRRFISQTFDRIEARQDFQVSHKKFPSFVSAGGSHRPNSSLSQPVPTPIKVRKRRSTNCLGIFGLNQPPTNFRKYPFLRFEITTSRQYA